MARKKTTLESGTIAASMPIPEVAQLPTSVAEMPWLDRLVLAADLYMHPRRFLSRATATDEELQNLAVLPKADKRMDVDELLGTMRCIWPGYGTSRLSQRRIQEMFVLNRLGQTGSGDPLEASVASLVSAVMPYGNEDYRPDAADRWKMRQHALADSIVDWLAEIEQAISRRLAMGDRVPGIVVNSELPEKSLVAAHSDDHLHFQTSYPLWMCCVRWDALPTDHVLKQIDGERLPRLGDPATGTSVVVLGPQQPMSISATPAPRRFYWLAAVAHLNDLAFRVHAVRHLEWLKVNLDWKDAEPLKRFEAVVKRQPKPPWVYPDLPPVSDLRGFLARTAFAVDALRNLRSYMKSPPPDTTLADLLAARRVFVDQSADGMSDRKVAAARAWAGRAINSTAQLELSESLYALAHSTYAALEELETDCRFDSLRAYQRSLSNGNGHK